MGRQMVGKSATYLFIESIIATFAGYLLWFFLTKLTTPDVIGVSSTVISLSLIFSQIIDLAVPTGSTRFLGRSFSEGQIEHTRVIVKGSFLIVCSSILICSVFILVFNKWLSPNISFDQTIILILLIGTSVIVNLMRNIFIASLKTQSLPKIMIISSSIRIVSSISLVLLGTGALGITIGYLSGFVSATVLLSVILVTTLTSVKKESTIRLYRTCKNILVASFPSWIPKVLAVVGTQLGTVLVFGSQGSNQAASYFIAISIFYAIDAIRQPLFSVAFPILSAMDDQRKRLTWRITKMSLVVSLPVSLVVILYSNEILGLFGPAYVQGAMSLKIILLSVFPLSLLAGISTLVYSYGNYWKVLAIGLGLNMPRVLLYFTLVPLYGSEGAAIAFTVGSLIGFGVSIFVAKKIGMMILWKELGLIIIIPSGLTFIMFYFHLTYIIGIPVILTLSLILMITSRVLSKSELRDSIGILPDPVKKPLIRFLNKV